MALERWGSLSVDDHKDTLSLVTNVLLYDRLVIPIMTKQDDRDEYAYWNEKEWAPDLQKRRVDQLAELAVKRPWDKAHRDRFRDRYQELAAERQDAPDAHAKQMTRRILAEESVERPVGVQDVTVVAAYNSLSALRCDFRLDDARDNQAAQAMLLTRRLTIPDLADPEDSLKVALALSRDADFRRRRAELFDWQETARARRLGPKEAVDYLVELTAAYNEKVGDARCTVKTRFAFTLASAGLGFATGGPIGAAVGAAISLLQFATLDRKPVVDAGSLAPVAMFHDISEKLGFVLR